ncbi:MAG: PaaI family thioesterase [Sulfurifustaceae bacterium]
MKQFADVRVESFDHEDSHLRQAALSQLLSREALARYSGLELLQRTLTGELPSPPMCQTLGFFLVEVELGGVVFEANPRVDYMNRLGSVHGGWAATVLDSCLGCAIHSMLPLGKAYATLDIRVSFVRAIAPDCGPMRAEGKVINVGRRVATAEGRLSDSTGRLFAHASSTCLIVEIDDK